MPRRLSLLLFPLLSACALVAGTMPLPGAADRSKLITFGLYVSPEHSPIQPPERFIGYHTALDLEIFEGEENAEVPVSAICPGEVVYSGSAEGYGGVLIHRCAIGEEPVTVLYGHLSLKELPKRGEPVTAGERIGILAPTRSFESGYNRKHLHLGIHRGEEIEFRGYVQDEKELEAFIDPESLWSLSFPTLPFSKTGAVFSKRQNG